MSLERLSVVGVRNLASVEIEPGSGLNWLQGPNGAGKTSVLEAIYLLARGRSFRSQKIASVIQHGVDELRVVARRRDSGRRLGMARSSSGWRGRIDGLDSQRLSEFARALPLVLMEPDSHRLVDGGPDLRRQYLDWQLFHVEQGYLDLWRRYARFLKQRNAALKAQAEDAVIDAIEAPMVAAGGGINRARQKQVETIGQVLEQLATELPFRLPGRLSLRYRPGHPTEQDLGEALGDFRDRDRELGYTRRGPHRADLVLSCGERPAAEELSRGQQKLLALLLLLAQLRLLIAGAPVAPLLLLDDPVSELDAPHLETLLEWLSVQQVQTWVTATLPCPRPASVFHVEQGEIRPVV